VANQKPASRFVERFILKFLPRFSLRFAWLALTIFLIVFAVSVKYWRAYQAHERVATKLESLQFRVEEEQDTLWGWVIAKRITGLSVQVVRELDLATAALGEIPVKSGLRRFQCQCHLMDAVPFRNYDDPKVQNQVRGLLRAVGELTSLETLELTLPIIPPRALQDLGSLQQLRNFKISFAELPPGELRSLLEQLPQLSNVNFYYDKSGQPRLDEVLAATIPNLRVLYLECPEQVLSLDLTSTGLGRFPKLEVLVLPKINLKRVSLAAGSLPQLKMLDLGGAEGDCDVDWKMLPAAAPQLIALRLHHQHVMPTVVTMLSKFGSLKYLHVAGIEGEDLPLLREYWLKDPSIFDPEQLPYELLVDLATRCSHCKFFSYAFRFWFDIPESESILGWSVWRGDIKALRPSSQGGFF
jgi:hypothetical protein